MLTEFWCVCLVGERSDSCNIFRFFFGRGSNLCMICTWYTVKLILAIRILASHASSRAIWTYWFGWWSYAKLPYPKQTNKIKTKITTAKTKTKIQQQQRCHKQQQNIKIKHTRNFEEMNISGIQLFSFLLLFETFFFFFYFIIKYNASYEINSKLFRNWNA